MASLFKSVEKISSLVIVFVLLLCSFSFTSTDAYNPPDRNENITITWDIMSWTPDGYVAVVTMFNFQQYRDIKAPGWSLGWTWAKKEVIWAMYGAQTTEQGNCSKFKGNIPHSCKKYPIVVDLLPSAPYNQQVANCCKGGVLSSWKNPANATSSFQLAVGAAGTTNKTVRLPKTFTFKAPGSCNYTCGPAKIVRPTRFITSDGRRITQAMMTWKVTCVYSRFLCPKSEKSLISTDAKAVELLTAESLEH